MCYHRSGKVFPEAHPPPISSPRVIFPTPPTEKRKEYTGLGSWLPLLPALTFARIANAGSFLVVFCPFFLSAVDTPGKDQLPVTDRAAPTEHVQ